MSKPRTIAGRRMIENAANYAGFGEDGMAEYIRAIEDEAAGPPVVKISGVKGTIHTDRGDVPARLGRMLIDQNGITLTFHAAEVHGEIEAFTTSFGDRQIRKLVAMKQHAVDPYGIVTIVQQISLDILE